MPCWLDISIQVASVAVSVLALIASVWAVWLVKRTLDATLSAVDVANNSLSETTRLGETQIRAYLAFHEAKIINDDIGSPKEVVVDFINAGQSPAHVVSIQSRLSYERQEIASRAPDTTEHFDMWVSGIGGIGTFATPLNPARLKIVYADGYDDVDLFLWCEATYVDVFGVTLTAETWITRKGNSGRNIFDLATKKEREKLVFEPVLSPT